MCAIHYAAQRVQHGSMCLNVEDYVCVMTAANFDRKHNHAVILCFQKHHFGEKCLFNFFKLKNGCEHMAVPLPTPTCQFACAGSTEAQLWNFYMHQIMLIPMSSSTVTWPLLQEKYCIVHFKEFIRTNSECYIWVSFLPALVCYIWLFIFFLSLFYV